MGKILIISSLLAFMLTQCKNSHASSFVFCMQMWFQCSCFSALSYTAAITVILLPFITIQSMMAISSLDEQYSYSSSCTLAVVNGQPYSTSSDSMPKCLLSSVAFLISSALMQSGMSMHDSIALVVMHMPGISSSLFVSWCVWISNLQWITVVQVCIVFLCCTDGSAIVYFGVCVLGLQHLSWWLAPTSCGL